MTENAARHEIFTRSWVDAWTTEIDASDAYRDAAETWEGSLALEAMAGPGLDAARAVVLDLHHGECRGGRVASLDDLDACDYILSADLGTWRRVLRGELDPILGIMTGKLKLRQGQLARLMPYTAASKELVACAARVPATFPND